MTRRQWVWLAGLAIFLLFVWTWVVWVVLADDLARPVSVPDAVETPTSISPQRELAAQATALPPFTPTPTTTPVTLVTVPPPATATPTRVVQQLQDVLSPPSPTVTPTSTPEPVSTPVPTLPPPTRDGRFLQVDQATQTMRVYEGGQLVREIPTSTGRPVSNAFTPSWQGTVGNYWGRNGFVDRDLLADYIWYLFDGPEGSILIHSVPYLLQGDVKVYDQLEALGREPVSNGCIRISPEDAAWLLDWNPIGVPIAINRLNLPIQPAPAE